MSAAREPETFDKQYDELLQMLEDKPQASLLPGVEPTAAKPDDETLQTDGHPRDDNNATTVTIIAATAATAGSGVAIAGSMADGYDAGDQCLVQQKELGEAVPPLQQQQIPSPRGAQLQLDSEP